MNRKQFLVLVIALLVLGGASLALFWQDIEAYRASGAKIGAKLLPGLTVAEVAHIELRDAKSKVTLVRKEKHWIVQERDGYPAEFKAISELIIKLSDLKVVQAESVGESFYARIELLDPGKGEGSGTLVELKDAGGKALASVVLGKVVLKKDPGNPLPIAQDGVPAGRYVRVLGAKEHVVVVSDPLASAQAQPGRWLDKQFFKADRIKTLTVAGEGASWKITRELEWGQWKFAGGGGDLDASAAVGAVNALGQLAFSDVETAAKPEGEGKPIVVSAETFDNLTYTLKLTKRKSGEGFLLNVSLAGEPPQARPPEKGEKAADKERRDKDFTESSKRLEGRIALEKALSAWTYVVNAKDIAPLTKTREQMVAQRKPADDRKRPR